MAEYLIAFNDDWVPNLTLEEIEARTRGLRPLVAEMREAGVLIFTGGLDPDAPIFNVVPQDGKTVMTDGPFIETKEHIGGFAVINADDAAQAQYWAEKIALACGWPQQVHRFQPHREVSE